MLWDWYRRIVMIGSAIALVCLEWDHPSGFSSAVFEGLAPLGSWWMHLHIIQSFLFGAVAIAVLLLTRGLYTFWAVVSKSALWLFLVCYLVFDSTAGISVGLMVEQALNNPSLDLDSMKELIQIAYKDPIVGGSGSLFSLTGSWAWSVSIIAAVLALYSENKVHPVWKVLPPLALLLVSAYSINVGHYSPYGPIGFACLGAASLWFEVFHFGPAARPLK